jgi:aminoglycoside phosphotransferase family enzyme
MYIIIDDFHCDAPSITPLFDFEAVKLGVAENIEWYSKRLKERTKESAYNRDERIVESMDERIVEVMNERIAEAMKDYEFLINILKSKQKFDINVTTKT